MAILTYINAFIILIKSEFLFKFEKFFTKCSICFKIELNISFLNFSSEELKKKL